MAFKGFPKEVLTFYRELIHNNDRSWFENHKQEYKQYVIAPAQQFVLAMGERLK